MLSTFLLLLLATTGLAMPQPVPELSPEVHKRNFTIVQQSCLHNCTRDCGSSSICGMLCTLKCPRTMKRADLSGEFGLNEENEEDGFEDIQAVATN
ncbi:hypothetical protein FSOLCH5_015049 [Fusarium solani]|uniref:Uncharacterized protein n=1 Tax=Fusarium solani TaxID=169388 RepID=A0A9P9K4X2_FUSSL|nr:uncharacterized protein B0J15DRAFT_550932 [Fusarium solani]KAH7249492.1 hypothetical protein B0J15DRAFT_550932 [Fusarium solani]KAJ3462431.1 hypothetical protein MRS44_007217 [Fusarium solani]KAJ4213991.1 hypothetical protein NW759_010517 [Fusarium solani]